MRHQPFLSRARPSKVTNLSLISWLLLLFCPGWRGLKTGVCLGPVINSLVYCVVIVYAFSKHDPKSLRNLEGAESLMHVASIKRCNQPLKNLWCLWNRVQALVGGHIFNKQVARRECLV